MAPKRKAAAKAKVPAKVKKEEPDNFRSTLEALKAAPKNAVKAKVDSACPVSAGEVFEDYDCMLNQTNIGHNNNKFYIIQLIQQGGKHSCWNRWGRVGEVGQSKLTPCSSLDAAKKDFEKKFKDKTKNNWADRENFVEHAGKYTMIEVQQGGDEDGETEVIVKTDTVDAPLQKIKKKVRTCSLDKPTQDLVSLIFSNDMFKEAMATMQIDVKKMPLGKLSKQQIAKGFEALEEIERSLQTKYSAKILEELSSRFYTIIPHNFGRTRPPVIDCSAVIQAKKDMLLLLPGFTRCCTSFLQVLADIELAQSLQATKVKKEEEEVLEQEVSHPLDEDYLLLKCELTLVPPTSKEFKIIQKYIDVTGSSYCKLKILNVWKVDREFEDTMI